MKFPLRQPVISLGLLVLPAVVAAQAPVSSSTQQPVATLEQRVERMERMLQSQGLLEIVQQLQQLQQEISMLRGEVETHNYNLDQLSRRQRDLYADIDQRLQRLEGGSSAPLDVTAEIVTPAAGEAPPLESLAAVAGRVESPSATPANSGLQVEVISNTTGQPEPGMTTDAAATTDSTNLSAPMSADQATGTPTATLPGQLDPSAGTGENLASAQAPARPVSTDPVQLQAEYQQAFNLLRQSLYDQAIQAFTQYLLDHPNDRYSDSAQYWLAEAYYVKREFEPALAEYNKVVSVFPESQKAADAMLKIGFTLIELGRIDEARTHLQSLITQQPDSTVARLADERLKQLGNTVQQQMPAEIN